MELTLFTDLIGALGKVAGGLKAIVNLLAAERETIRQTVNGIYAWPTPRSTMKICDD